MSQRAENKNYVSWAQVCFCQANITSYAIKIIAVVQLDMRRTAWYNVVGSAARLCKKE